MKFVVIIACCFCFLMLSCQSNNDKPGKVEVSNTDSSLTVIQQEEQQIDTLLNTENYLVLGNQPATVKVVNENEVEDYPTYEILIGDGEEVIIGVHIDYDNLELYRKYHPKTSFTDYPADIYKGKLAEPDFSSDPDAKRFITRIKKECANGINFAGHYTLVTWGCGSPCQSGVVVDRKTGKIYGGYGTSLGSSFRKDSRMIIRNVEAIDTTTNLIRICAFCDVNHEVWTGTTFKEVE